MRTHVERFLTTRYLALRNAANAGDRGQGLVEYALIVALIAIVTVGALTTLGTNVTAKFTSIGASL